MGPGIPEPENTRPNPTFLDTRDTRTRNFKPWVLPDQPDTRLQYPIIPESGIPGNFLQ